MTILGWIALAIGGIILLPLILALVRRAARIERVLPTQASGILALVMLVVLFYLTTVFGMGRVLLWVWIAAGGCLLLVFLQGLLSRARTERGQRR